MTFVVKHWRPALTVISVAFLLFVLLKWSELIRILDSPADTVFENLAIEFTAGIIFIVVPLVLGVSFGKRARELEFYHDIERVFQTLISLRSNGLIEPHTVRHLVKTITKNFGNEAVKQQWLGKAAKRLTQLQIDNTKNCKVCTLQARIENHKCEFCELNCYAWDYGSQAEGAKEEQEITRIVEIVRSKRNE